MVASNAEPGSQPATDGGDAQPSAARFTVGGRFELDISRPLGTGGLCAVYRGRDARTRAAVAAKTLRPEYRHDPATRARFRREGRLLAFLAHPNVVRVEAFVEERDSFWVVLEYLGGPSVRRLMDERGPMPPEAVVPILDQAAAGLSHLHARGMVHLDVKPENLLSTEDGALKLIDFGLAQPVGQPQAAMGNRTLATAAYLAPEQACGDPVTAGSDLYALGCVVYELLTGRPPFVDPRGRQSLNDLVSARLAGDPPPPSAARPDLAIAPWIDEALRWALARDPNARYNDISTFARLFRDGVEGDLDAPPPARPAPTEVAHRPVSRYDRQWVRPGGGAEPADPKTRGAAAEPRDERPRRRARWDRLAWAAVAAALAANLLVGGVLVARRGGLPPFAASREPELQPGGVARVVGEGLVVRDGPSQDAAPLGRLPAGARLRLAGPPVADGSGLWWPATVSLGEGDVTGYIPADWLVAAGT